MTDNEKICFIYGYLYRMAQEAREEGFFSDMELKDIVKIYLDGYLRESN